MNLIVHAVGRLKDGPERSLCASYLERAQTMGRARGLRNLTVVEAPESRARHTLTRKRDEWQALSARHFAKPPAPTLWLLDESGTALSSEAFAQAIAGTIDRGAGTLVIAIGGADGHGPDAWSASQRQIAFGHMTLPHGLARIVLVEQIYRAFTILGGHPYHRA